MFFYVFDQHARSTAIASRSQRIPPSLLHGSRIPIALCVWYVPLQGVNAFTPWGSDPAVIPVVPMPGWALGSSGTEHPMTHSCVEKAADIGGSAWRLAMGDSLMTAPLRAARCIVLSVNGVTGDVTGMLVIRNVLDAIIPCRLSQRKPTQTRRYMV